MTVNPAAIVVNDEAAAAIYKWMRGQTANGNGVALVGAIDAVATAAKVNKGAGLRPKALLIDDEVVEVTARTGDDLTITRGMLGTVAAAHEDGAKVTVLKYATLKELCGAILFAKLREILDLSPPATVLTAREARKLAETEEKAAMEAAIA